MGVKITKRNTDIQKQRTIKREVFLGRETENSLLFVLSFNTCQRRKRGHGDQNHPLTMHERQVADNSDMDVVTRLPPFRISLSPLLDPLSCLSYYIIDIK